MSMRVDVHVHGVRHADVGAAKAETPAEQEQEHEHDDDQQDDRQHSAAAAAAAGLDNGRAFALGLVPIIIVGHGNSPSRLLLWRNEPMSERFRAGGERMRRRARTIAAAALALWGCSKAADQKVTSKAEEPA